MAQYEIVYSEIKMKRFNKLSTAKEFVFGKNSSVNHVLRVVRRKNKLLYSLDLLNWFKGDL